MGIETSSPRYRDEALQGLQVAIWQYRPPKLKRCHNLWQCSSAVAYLVPESRRRGPAAPYLDLSVPNMGPRAPLLWQRAPLLREGVRRPVANARDAGQEVASSQHTGELERLWDESPGSALQEARVLSEGVPGWMCMGGDADAQHCSINWSGLSERAAM